MEKIVFLVVLALGHVTSDRVYESECPEVAPMQGFDMTKFLGVWYQVQPDTGSDEPATCEFYNVTNSSPDLYAINEMIEIYARFEGNTPLQYESVSTSYLDVIDGSVPASMRIRETHFGESNFTIFATDYDSYAIISSCHKGSNADSGADQFTQHTKLWSRTRVLEENFVVKLYDSIGLIDFDPYDLNTIDNTGCLEGGKTLARVNLDNGEIVPI